MLYSYLRVPDGLLPHSRAPLTYNIIHITSARDIYALSHLYIYTLTPKECKVCDILLTKVSVSEAFFLRGLLGTVLFLTYFIVVFKWRLSSELLLIVTLPSTVTE